MCDFDVLHRVLYLFWTGRRPNQRVKPIPTMFRATLIVYDLAVNSISTFLQMNSMSKLLSWQIEKCTLKEYEAHSMPYPIREASQGLCIHKFFVQTTTSDKVVPIIELTSGVCKSDSYLETNWTYYPHKKDFSIKNSNDMIKPHNHKQFNFDMFNINHFRNNEKAVLSFPRFINYMTMKHSNDNLFSYLGNFSSAASNMQTFSSILNSDDNSSENSMLFNSKFLNAADPPSDFSLSRICYVSPNDPNQIILSLPDEAEVSSPTFLLLLTLGPTLGLFISTFLWLNVLFARWFKSKFDALKTKLSEWKENVAVRRAQRRERSRKAKEDRERNQEGDGNAVDLSVLEEGRLREEQPWANLHGRERKIAKRKEYQRRRKELLRKKKQENGDKMNGQADIEMINDRQTSELRSREEANGRSDRDDHAMSDLNPLLSENERNARRLEGSEEANKNSNFSRQISDNEEHMQRMSYEDDEDSSFEDEDMDNIDSPLISIDEALLYEGSAPHSMKKYLSGSQNMSMNDSDTPSNTLHNLSPSSSSSSSSSSLSPSTPILSPQSVNSNGTPVATSSGSRQTHSSLSYTQNSQKSNISSSASSSSSQPSREQLRQLLLRSVELRSHSQDIPEPLPQQQNNSPSAHTVAPSVKKT